MRWNPRFSAIPVCLPVIITEPTMGLLSGSGRPLCWNVWSPGQVVMASGSPSTFRRDPNKDGVGYAKRSKMHLSNVLYSGTCTGEILSEYVITVVA